MLNKYLIFMGVMLSVYDAKQINYFRCRNYDHLLEMDRDLLLKHVKGSGEKKLFEKNSILSALKEVIIL